MGWLPPVLLPNREPGSLRVPLTATEGCTCSSSSLSRITGAGAGAAGLAALDPPARFTCTIA